MLVRMGDGQDKQYSDACVQTSPISVAAPSHDSNTVNTTPIPSRLKRVTYIDQTASGACYDESRSRRVYPRTPISRTKTQLPLNRPNEAALGPSLSLLPDEQRRVVSLPERMDSELLPHKLMNSLAACSRNVSMPAAVQHFPQTQVACEDLPSMHVSPSILYEELSGSRSYAQTSDFPCTPSLDSSSSSIEIIDGSLNVSATFLQARDNRTKAIHKDWLNWNCSPPRPIPALHGPSSLPYARCPSGAEGTILEEQSNVPGLIWGLKDSSATAERSMVNQEPQCISSTTSAIKAQPEALRRDGKDAGDVRAQSFMGSTQDAEHPSGHESVTPPNTESEAPKALDNVKDNLERTHQSSIDSSNSGKRAEQPITTIGQEQLRQVPGALVDIILHEKQRHGCSVSVDALPRNQTFAHEAFVRCDVGNVPFKSRCTKAENTQRAEVDENHIDTCPLRLQCTCSQYYPPTPPDSTSSVWLSQFPPLIMDWPSAYLRRNQEVGGLPSASQPCALELRTSEECSERLSNRLKRLIIRDQVTPDHCRERVRYSAQEQSSAPPFHRILPTMPNATPSKPEMPINLHDLVTRHVQGQYPAEPGFSKCEAAVRTKPLSLDSVASGQSLLPTVKAEKLDLTASAACQGNPEMHGEVLPGMRYPRSIPFTRLLERKLAPVPEETSFTSTGTETTAPRTHASLPPISTSRQMKKDYDFAELRSPLEETMGKEKLTSQQETPHIPTESRILQPSGQRKRQPKQKAATNAKSAPVKTKERKNDENDENVHVIEPVPSTSRKKSKALKPSARGFNSRKPRRVN